MSRINEWNYYGIMWLWCYEFINVKNISYLQMRVQETPVIYEYAFFVYVYESFGTVSLLTLILKNVILKKQLEYCLHDIYAYK